MIVASVGRGDDAPFRRDVTNVERGAAALVAIDDGGDVEHAHGACRSSGRGVLPHDVGGRTRRRTIAIGRASCSLEWMRMSAVGRSGGREWHPG
ncbi:MAG: hypothetical protein OXP75_02560 [Rhodospirillales bacterium]|nr:hypothetical protein [Rhodospirillales bacterium]